MSSVGNQSPLSHAQLSVEEPLQTAGTAAPDASKVSRDNTDVLQVNAQYSNVSVLDSFIEMYQRLNKNNLEILAQVYDETIEFQDPLHQVLGLTALTEYFAELYSNVSSIAFDIHQVQLMQTVDGSQAQIANAYQEQIANGSQALPEQGLQSACLFWTMTYQHPKLNRGQAINVEGMSQLQFTDKIIKHRDYFDAGQMLYQHVPILGSMIRILNKRIGGQA